MAPAESFFKPLVAGGQKIALAFSVAPPVQALRGLPCLGSFSVAPCIRHTDGSLWLGSYSLYQCFRHLMGQPLSCLATNAGCGEREAMLMAPPATHDSAALPCSLAAWVSSMHFPPQSPPSHPLHPSVCSHQHPSPWDCSIIPKFQLPAAVPSRGLDSLSRVCMATARTVWFSFHVGRCRSAVSLSFLNVPPLTQTSALKWRLDPCFSSPTSQVRVQSY